jgi:hypothetical protein
MVRGMAWLGIILIALIVGAGCGGDEKGVNVNKEKPQPASK